MVETDSQTGLATDIERLSLGLEDLDELAALRQSAGVGPRDECNLAEYVAERKGDRRKVQAAQVTELQRTVDGLPQGEYRDYLRLVCAEGPSAYPTESAG